MCTDGTEAHLAAVRGIVEKLIEGHGTEFNRPLDINEQDDRNAVCDAIGEVYLALQTSLENDSSRKQKPPAGAQEKRNPYHQRGT